MSYEFIKIVYKIFTALVILCFTGCNALRLSQAPVASKDDWQFYGGTIERKNVSPYELKPPLALAWEQDASASFSPYSAAIVENILFIGSLQGEVQAIDIRTGKELGSRDFGSAVYGTPVLDGMMMYVVLGHDEESLVAYNLMSGKTIWKAKLGDIETSPLLMDNHLYVTTLDGKLVCIEKEKGKTVWEFAVPAHSSIHSSPASDGNVIVFGCDDGALYAVNKNDGKLKWRTTTRGSILASPSIKDTLVYAGSLDSSFYAIHIATGKIVWTQNLGTKIYASQTIGEENLYIGTPTGIMFALNLMNGSVAWTFKTSSVISAPSMIAGNILYIGSNDNNLYALEAKTGQQIWKYTTEGRIRTMPLVYKEYVVILQDDRTITALKQAR